MNRYVFKIPGVILGLLVLFLVFSGCSGPGRIADNETPVTPPATQVPAAPHQLYVKEGQYENFSYWGHTIAINYSSAYPSKNFLIVVDGSEKVIQKNLTDSPRGIDWSEGNISLTLKPVVWELRNGQNVPIYESTWNTTEVYFIVHIIDPTSQVAGGAK
jgi:hypothetical protein